jgi:Cu(I)/Ag(I) efflux system membrane fusion protein
MKNILYILLGGVITLTVLGLSREFLATNNHSQLSEDSMAQAEPEVLYWVAPMDANFRRDEPGKSPMGMDLMPVYANASGDSELGVVKISQGIINNLGVRTAKVSYSQPRVSFISSGQVHYSKESLLHFHSRSSGWVEKLYVSDMGQKIKKGQALYGIYSLELIDAQEDYLRALKANDTGLIRAANNRMKALRIDRKVIRQLKRSRKVNQVTTYYAPQDGYVEKLSVNQGMYVKPENALLTLASLETVVVDVEVDHRQAAWLSQFPGKIQWALTSELMPTQVWQGDLDYIYPMLNEKLRTLSLRLLVKNTDQLLKPNMWLSLNGTVLATEKTLLIPSQALIRGQNENRVVLALGEGRYKSVGVSTGRHLDQQVEIVEGLVAGDRVVTSAQFLLDSESAIDSDLQRMDSTLGAQHDR